MRGVTLGCLTIAFALGMRVLYLPELTNRPSQNGKSLPRAQALTPTARPDPKETSIGAWRLGKDQDGQYLSQPSALPLGFHGKTRFGQGPIIGRGRIWGPASMMIRCRTIYLSLPPAFAASSVQEVPVWYGRGDTHFFKVTQAKNRLTVSDPDRLLRFMLTGKETGIWMEVDTPNGKGAYTIFDMAGFRDALRRHRASCSSTSIADP